MSKRTVLVWTDLETTGLDARGGRILEYAVVLTDLELNEVGSLTAVIPQNVEIARAMMDDYVTNMHTKNGLLEELESLEGNALQYGDSIEEADEELAAFLKHVAFTSDGNGTVFVMAGSNILFDVDWMMEHMPKTIGCVDHRSVIDGPASYRCMDVSSYKVGFPDLFKSSTSATHRAMDDIRYSLGMHVRLKMIVGAGVKAMNEQGIILGV